MSAVGSMRGSEIAAFARGVRSGGRSGRWAIFGCGDSGYVAKLLVALASVKKFHPDLDAYIFCPAWLPDDDVAASRAGVVLVPIDPSSPFGKEAVSQGAMWPRESFGHLLAWKILSCCGYEFSLSIDGDALCCGPLPLESTGIERADFACVCNGSVGRQFRLSDVPEGPARDFLSELPRAWRRTPNTGIMLWNHRRLKRCRFHRRILETFESLPAGYRAASDQHLLAIAIARFPFRIRWLDTRWNFCRGGETGLGSLALRVPEIHPDRLVSSLAGIWFLHLFKPWERMPDGGGWIAEPGPAAENCYRSGTKRWIAIGRELYGEKMPIRLLGRSVFEPPDLEPVALPRFLRARRVARRIFGPVLMIPGFVRSERRAVFDFLAARPPVDFSVGLLQRWIPALRPGRLLSRAREREARCGGRGEASQHRE